MRTPLAAIAVLLAILVPVGFATEESGNSGGPAPAPLDVIAHRVEALRGLRFERLPEPVTVSAEDAKREGLADLERSYPLARRRADEDLYAMLGLLPAGTDLKDISASIFGEQVAGYYDPRDGRLRVVEGAGDGDRVNTEMVLAHELTHALEDQRAGFDLDTIESGDDAALAYQALVEGTATAIMNEYVDTHFRGEEVVGSLLASSFKVTSTTPLPPFVVESMVFPYLEGEQFVDRLYADGRDSWRLLDSALRFRPPASTEQVLHPRKWLRFEAPDTVTVPAPGPGYRRLTGGTLGEFQTAKLLALAGPQRPEAAAGWGGDRYELWRRGPEACKTPCVARDVLVLRWRWDSPRDAAEFEVAVRDLLDDGYEARPAGVGRWEHRGGGVAVRTAGGALTLAFAPTVAEAARVAGG